jgi:hypothetical protein
MTAKIYYSLNQGLTWLFSGQADADTGSYDWQVPLTKKPTATCRVKVILFNGTTAVGIKFKDGVVLIVDKRVSTKLLEGTSIEKIFKIDDRDILIRYVNVLEEHGKGAPCDSAISDYQYPVIEFHSNAPGYRSSFIMQNF